MHDDAAERRKARILLGTAILACLVLLAALIPSPFLIELPGPVVDTLGETEIEGESVPVIEIEGADTYPTSGELNLLTVWIDGDPEHRVSWLQLIPALLDSSQAIIPMSQIYPEGFSTDDREAQNTALMAASQHEAAAAAYAALGERVSAELSVAGVADGGPAAGVLEAGDVLRTVDGEPIGNFTELRRMIVEHGEGEPMTLGIERDGAERDARLTPVVPEGGDEPLIGVTIASEYDLPFEADISLAQIGGPSAGMVFALAIYDRLTPGGLLEDLSVSGTGTVDEAGDVGAIGGLPQKMWSASRAGSELFLMPIDNCSDVPANRPDDLLIAPVATLEEAIAAIETAAAGGTPGGLERCG